MIAELPHLWRPLQVGTMALDHRLVVSPHSGGGGSLVGSQELFERHCAYWVAKVTGGVQWVGGGPTFVRNPLVPGFEPTGTGANGPGLFRHPMFVERMAGFVERIHSAGGFTSCQFVLQGGMPIAPSSTLSGYADHRIPHALDATEVAWLVDEYGGSARLAASAGVDAIELHANHDDVLQWFLSPLTNRRTDGYGGSFDNRRRLVREIVEQIRRRVDRPLTVGLRLCLDEMIDGGYALDGCQQLLEAFTADGTIDYFSLDMGSNWGPVSYIPPGSYPEGEWAALCGQAKQATDLPVVYVGRVVKPATAEHILADGHADLVGFARAMIADPDYVLKVRAGEIDTIRPCIGVNECIDRRVVEGLGFACATNPRAGREDEPVAVRSSRPSSLLVVGAGPAGLELAGLAAERGHRVTVLERNGHVGGQLALAAMARMNSQYADWLTWQTRRLDRLDVELRLGQDVSADDIIASGADVVAVATGAVPRRPDIAGIDLQHVVSGAAALGGTHPLGQRVLLVSEDDRAAPLVIADHLAHLGHAVRVVHQTTAPSPLVGKYTIGAILARLDEQHVELISATRVVAIHPDRVELAHCYSGRRWTLDDVDSVVLACGSVADDALFHAVSGQHPRVHLLGDAYAPRRVASATRQAWELAKLLD